MSTIGTTSFATPFQFPGQSYVDRSSWTGIMYALVRVATTQYAMYRSTDGGTTWAATGATQTRTGLVETSGVVASNGTSVNICYRTNESSQDRIYFRSFDTVSATWFNEVLVAAVGNGGSAGAVHTGMDFAPVGLWDGRVVIAVVVGTTVGSTYGVTVYGVSISAAGVAVADTSFLSGTRQWLAAGTSGRITPSCEFEHTGDYHSAPFPNLWIAWGRTELYTVKMAWGTAGAGWSGPTTPVTVKTGLAAQDSSVGRWDGHRWLMCAPNPTAGMTSTVTVFERNQANSATIERVTPTHPTGVVKNCTLSYNVTSGDIRVYAVGTSTTVLYYVDYIRQSGTWTTWTSVLATAVLGTNGDNYGVRRGSSGNARHDVYTAHTGTPNTLTHTQQTLSYAPFTPTWVSPPNGQGADVAQALVLDWTFGDPDPADTQLSYALSRQIGAGALAYFRASDQTWQATEQVNASGTSARTLASGWGSGSDAVHTYRVKVFDQASTASNYSDAIAVNPSAIVNPTITAPTPAQVIGANQVTATWTVAEQTQWRVELLTNPGGVVTYDSGWAPNQSTPGTPSQLTFTVPYVLANSTGWTLRLTTRNNEGLASTPQTVNFTVSYTAPATPTLVATPVPASGWTAVVITNPTPSGGQPAVAGNDVYRRVVGDTSNGTRIAANVTNNGTANDWRAVSGVAYEYRILTNGVNGASVFGAWTT